MDLSITKSDVINELRSERYFNEQEISRLVQSNEIKHKDRVAQIAQLTKENVLIIEAIKLIEVYFPAAKPTPVPTPVPTPSDTPTPS